MPKDQAEITSLVLMIVIVDNGEGEKIAELFGDSAFSLLTMGRGTASMKILSCLGLGETERDILFNFVSYEMSRVVLKKLADEWDFDKPGKGVAFCVPVNGISDTAELHDLIQNQGGILMKGPYQHDLIIAVTNQGYADEVMDVAQSAGAPGGTVMHARGAGLNQAKKFFGISIQPEKEVLLILVKKGLRRKIMAEIVEKKGAQTDAHTIVFSLPVDGIAGVCLDR